ncbi:MAG: helix-turn-helix domain-containing protein [Pseudolabrys sp.]
MLAARLKQLQNENGGHDRFQRKLGLARGTYYQIARGLGNPTFLTIQRIATALNMSVFELLGFEDDDARRAMKKTGLDLDKVMTAIEKKNYAERILARRTRLRKSAS